MSSWERIWPIINVVRRGHVARSGGIWRACAVPLPMDSAARGLGTDLIALSRTLVVMAERGLQICESQAARYFCEIWPAGCRMAVIALKISLVWRRVLGRAILTGKHPG